ncbi:regulatory iron-sulfur-containing complex subunit RicT [Mangrovibacterium marinum]|uniref:Cell fate regulator YaaT (PSP1 superfamily) n=1 Tax=Mangrovibacterium marinum TaxID=1639118 RepID=A0A2T5C6K6_9BACT|nr:regulatory iron-sulfur-containing complex subunit RicT [Mangrovibacterium marinum]PTN10584.1 cell fate regulator YaaT (PSP1 superfamily) [Mangrovibacterium marinum]
MEDNYTVNRGCCAGGAGTCSKLEVHDWLSDVVHMATADNIVEVRFKNTRKEYFRNHSNLKLKIGDIVAVEANPGHDIGVVSLTGELVKHQVRKHKVKLVNGDFRKIYRKAKQADIDKWKEAISLEHKTMIRSRQIAADLRLDMKIGDVEYQGDKTKAIFYYIAEGRVDFRQLIKVLAESFRIRIEMKQIGARQEAGRIGGIGPCGRELCCATWMSNFVSVTTNAARFQEISLNPQKLAGQCGKLKCCLNYEVDSYIDAQRDFPPNNIVLEIKNGQYHFLKADVFNRIMYYIGTGENSLSGPQGVPVDRVKEIILMNKKGRKPEKLIEYDDSVTTTRKPKEFEDVLSQDSLTRFDQPKSKRNRKKKRPAKKGDSGGRPSNRGGDNTRNANTKRTNTRNTNKGGSTGSGDNKPQRPNNRRRRKPKSDS